MTPKWSFGVAMLPVGRAHGASTRRILGARCFQNGDFGRISSALYLTVFQSLGGRASTKRVSHEPCFRQGHCFVQGPLRFLPVPPNPTCARPHIWGFPKFTGSFRPCRPKSQKRLKRGSQGREREREKSRKWNQRYLKRRPSAGPGAVGAMN